MGGDETETIEQQNDADQANHRAPDNSMLRHVTAAIQPALHFSLYALPDARFQIRIGLPISHYAVSTVRFRSIPNPANMPPRAMHSTKISVMTQNVSMWSNAMVRTIFNSPNTMA